MSDLIKPAFQTRPYSPHEVVRIRDRYQMYKYISNNVYPCDLYTSGNDLIMVFLKNETKELYEKWRNREL